MEPGKKLDDQLLTSSVQLTPGKDGYLFTADANIIHTGWKLFYKITDPLQYYKSVILPSNPKNDDQEFKDPKTGESLGTRGPRTLLLATLDNAIIKTCAVTVVDDILNSPDFRNKVSEIVTREIDDLNIGITVNSVKMPAKTPPLGTVQAFRALTEAKLKSATLKHDAENYKVKTLNAAESQAATLLADADAYKTEIVASMRSEAKTFNAILKEYNKNPKTVPVALYSDALTSVLKSADDIFVLKTNKQGSQELRLLLNREPPKIGKQEK
jgi:regulator of protease activity HflC (stomatin/prohibitin superfamily)